MSDRIALGVIRKAHGVRGEASVEPWTDFERFTEVRRVTLVSPDESQTREVTIEAARLHAERALIKFSTIDSPEAVADFQRWTIEIPQAEAKQLDADEYFLHDLVGLTLVDAAGKEQGTVSDAYEGGAGVLLEVTRGDRKFDVPFAAAICKEIDLEAKRIVVELPEGIDEV
ncbi:MAG TPA: ribosome maturation factor RimM [Thermoanaerobaculia bacterium]|jgi:16S rRNA processing protein RimM|nr:ribosome maturation factor RimM [Thermoanaerobaculia bacterium]